MLPNFIGIGAPKAGTTWLFKCLQEHPQIYMAPVKETNFFDYATIEGRLPEYEAHFAGAAGHPAIGEISTRYLTSTRAPARIQGLIPQIKLFVSLRNPIDQVYSHYWHLQRQNFHQWGVEKMPGSFEEALQEYERQLVQPSLYAQHLTRWLQTFERAQLLALCYDDIQSSPQNTLSTLYRFLEVDSALVPGSLRETGSEMRQGVSPKSPQLGRLYQVCYAALNRRIYYPAKKMLGVRNAIRIKDTLNVRKRMEQLFFRQGYPPMRRETRSYLRTLYEQDILETERLTGLNLAKWRCDN